MSETVEAILSSVSSLRRHRFVGGLESASKYRVDDASPGAKAPSSDDNRRFPDFVDIVVCIVISAYACRYRQTMYVVTRSCGLSPQLREEFWHTWYGEADDECVPL